MKNVDNLWIMVIGIWMALLFLGINIDRQVRFIKVQQEQIEILVDSNLEMLDSLQLQRVRITDLELQIVRMEDNAIQN